jgi:hypothetical protein
LAWALAWVLELVWAQAQESVLALALAWVLARAQGSAQVLGLGRVLVLASVQERARERPVAEVG